MPRPGQFIDLTAYIHKFEYYHHLSFFSAGTPLMYPAPVLLAYKIFCLGAHTTSPDRITLRFGAIIVASALFMAAMLCVSLVRRGLRPSVAIPFMAGSLILSYPLWFELSRLNMEFAVWVIVSLGLYQFWHGRSWSAGALFGIAAAMKIYPFVFLCLLLTRRQYRQITFAIMIAVAVTTASLWLLYPDIAVSFRLTNAGVDAFKQMYMLHLRPAEIGFDHSLFGLIKRLFPVLPLPETLNRILQLYLAMAAVFGIFLYFVRIRKLPLVNQVTCLTICSILLPPTSYDYTLLHLYAPWAMLLLIYLDATQAGKQLRNYGTLSLIIAAYALLMSPQSEIIFHGSRYAGQFKALVLVALLYLSLRYPIEVEPASSPSPQHVRGTEFATR